MLNLDMQGYDLLLRSDESGSFSKGGLCAF